VRQQNALERLLERKIRLLMELQEHRIVYVAPPPAFDPRPAPTGGANPSRDPALSRGKRVARDGAFTNRRGSGEGSLASYPSPTQKAENSGNELNDLLQSNGLTPNDPSKRTVPSAQNETHRRRGGPCGRPCGPNPARVAGTEAGRVPQPQADRVPLCADSAPKTEYSRNELHDLLQSKGLTQNDPSKRTVPSAQNETHRRRGGPCGRPCGLDPARVAGTEAGRVPQPRADRIPLCASPAPKTENSWNELHDLLQSKGLTKNDPSKRTGHSAQNEPVRAHLCASGHGSRSRRVRSGSADRRVCGPRFFVEGGIRKLMMSYGVEDPRTSKPALPRRVWIWGSVRLPHQPFSTTPALGAPPLLI
jgi:hypothetical protein